MIIDDQLTISETPINFRTSVNPKLLKNTVIKFYETIVKRDCKSILILTFRFRIVITEFICWYRCYGTITKVDKLEDMHRLVLLFLC